MRSFGLRLLVGALVAVCLAPGASPVSARTIAIPDGVDPSALSQPTVGPQVATGTLFDAGGRPAPGYIAVLAWPNEDYSRTLRVGDVVNTPTIGWTKSGLDGSFALRMDGSRLGADFIRPDGTVNMTAVGWTASSQGTWSFTTRAPALGLAGMRSSAGPAVRSFNIRADQPLLKSAGILNITCGWILVSTSLVWATIGQTFPWGNDTGTMTSSSNQSMAVGVGYSSNGTLWSQNGTSTTTSGVSFTWSPSIWWRNYQVQLKYGKYRYCGAATNTYEDMAMYGTGGFQSQNLYNLPSFPYCVTVNAGTWTRSSGNSWSSSVAVQTGGYIGINLSLTSGYDTSHEMIYVLMASGKVCGDNDYPSRSNNVETSR